MRISDWSSDVCSSDHLLIFFARQGQLVVLDMLLEDQVRGAREDIVRSHEEILLEAFFLAPVLSGQDLLIGLRARIHDVGGAYVALELHQLGSASCRDRVCQYELITVIAVAFKKKTMRDR